MSSLQKDGFDLWPNWCFYLWVILTCFYLWVILTCYDSCCHSTSPFKPLHIWIWIFDSLLQLLHNDIITFNESQWASGCNESLINLSLFHRVAWIFVEPGLSTSETILIHVWKVIVWHYWHFKSSSVSFASSAYPQNTKTSKTTKLIPNV